MRFANKEIIIPFLVVLVVYIILIIIYIYPYQNNLSSLVKLDANDPNYRADLIPPGTIVFQGSGYDGQYNFYIVKDLFFQGTFNDPFRYQRIFYPVLVKLISFGSDNLLFISFILVNLISIFLGIVYLQKIVGKSRFNHLLILYGLNLGFILGTLYDLGTPLAISLMVIALYYLQKEKVWVSSIFFALSLLTMENAMLVIVPLVFYSIWKKEFKQSVYLLGSFIPWLLWQLVLWKQFGIIPILTSSGVLTFPLMGIEQQIIWMIYHQEYFSIKDFLRDTNIIWMMLFVVACLIIGAYQFSKDKDKFSFLILAQA
ncbi:MAG: hypothetical protein QME64_10985, partial [bacterium]|nr:hypothetical protein [bacterium]